MRFKLLVFFVLTTTAFYSQSLKVDSFFSEGNKEGEIKGIIMDTNTNNDPLAFTNVTVKELNLTTTTAIDGSYSFKIQPGTYTLIFDFVGYHTQKLTKIVVTSGNATLCNQSLTAIKINSDISLISLN